MKVPARRRAKPEFLDAFKKDHCRQCHHSSTQTCQIEYDGTNWDVDSPWFPDEWLYGTKGYTCTAFEAIDEPLKYRCPDTLELPL